MFAHLAEPFYFWHYICHNRRNLSTEFRSQRKISLRMLENLAAIFARFAVEFTASSLKNLLAIREIGWMQDRVRKRNDWGPALVVRPSDHKATGTSPRLPIYFNFLNLFFFIYSQDCRADFLIRPNVSF
jgi:hypothetical protein